jgi:hypothetical protein
MGTNPQFDLGCNLYAMLYAAIVATGVAFLLRRHQRTR